MYIITIYSYNKDMLKRLIKEKGISVYRLCKDTNLPYTTVNEIVLGKKNIEDCSVTTISVIASYFRVPIEYLFNNKIKKINNNYLNSKRKKYKFNLVESNEYYDSSLIYPLKQVLVNKIVNKYINDNRISKLIIFGSSINNTCTIHSDLDIALLLNEKFNNKLNKNDVSEYISEICNYDVDIVWIDKLDKDSLIYKNIMKGVIIK